MQIAAQAVRPVQWEDVSRKSGAEVKEAAGLQLSFSPLIQMIGRSGFVLAALSTTLVFIL